MSNKVTVIGGGLAGAEAAYQLAIRGVDVCLKEMRGIKQTPAHQTDSLAELVCSNSLGSDKLSTAPGLLKAELKELGSLIMEAAEKTRVPAGGALAVDRERFAAYIEEKLKPLVTIEREEVTSIPDDGIAIIATGPLTSDALAGKLKETDDHLYFYDAISPIIDGESIDYERAFRGSRYDENSSDYLNCPMNEEEYDRFYDALITAELAEIKEFEKYFEGCMPIETMAARGKKTILFGPMKPVGLKDKDGNQPFCVCQLRREDLMDSCFNLVGFQTRLKYGEQKRVFGMIPALASVKYLRYGSVHRNTFINSPLLLKNTLQLKDRENVFMAGQLIGVEGYVESTAMGLLAGMNVYNHLNGKDMNPPGNNTAMGSLVNYVTGALENFQPMNINFGLLPPLEKRERSRRARREKVVERGIEEIKLWKNSRGS